jgi:exo-beta-1,3-glucanase (GH17 family)
MEKVLQEITDVKNYAINNRNWGSDVKHIDDMEKMHDALKHIEQQFGIFVASNAYQEVKNVQIRAYHIPLETHKIPMKKEGVFTAFKNRFKTHFKKVLTT